MERHRARMLLIFQWGGAGQRVCGDTKRAMRRIRTGRAPGIPAADGGVRIWIWLPRSMHTLMYGPRKIHCVTSLFVEARFDFSSLGVCF
jgi:hypothetical protein